MGVVARRPRADELVERRRDARCRSASVAKRGSVAHSGCPTTSRERRPLGVVADGDHAPLVVARARVHTPRRAERAPVALRVDRAGHEALLEDELREVVDDRVGLRDADVTATAVADAGQRGERAEPRRELVGEEDRVLGEVALGVGIAPQRRLRADAPRVRAEPAPPTPRSPVTEQLAAHHDDARIGVAERLADRARGCRARRARGSRSPRRSPT